jgi:Rod binding domain-containing protein
MSVPIVNEAAAVSAPPIANEALEPASVRSGGAAAQKAYTSALDFESMLVQQLSQSLSQAGGLGSAEGGEGEGGESDGGEGGEGAGGVLSSMLPQALTEGVMHDGGLGLAQQLMPALDPSLSNKLSSTGGIAA